MTIIVLSSETSVQKSCLSYKYLLTVTITRKYMVLSEYMCTKKDKGTHICLSVNKNNFTSIFTKNSIFISRFHRLGFM